MASDYTTYYYGSRFSFLGWVGYDSLGLSLRNAKSQGTKFSSDFWILSKPSERDQTVWERLVLQLCKFRDSSTLSLFLMDWSKLLKLQINSSVGDKISQVQMVHFFKKGFRQTSRHRSLLFWFSITRASQWFCVASVRACSITCTLSEKITQPCQKLATTSQNWQLNQPKLDQCKHEISCYARNGWFGWI